MNGNQPPTISTYSVRRGTSILALNCADNRLIAAGQLNFQLLSIEQIDNTEQFNEIYDFRDAPRQSTIPRYALQPKDVSWNQIDEHCFATASSKSGDLYTWDATRLAVVNEYNVHNTLINRLQFHPKHPNILLTASQDGYAKLIDFRINDNGKVISTFRHSSKEGFRDIDINRSNTDKFAAVINDQYSVPIWDIRQPAQPEFSVLTQDKVLCIAWNPYERSWLATGGVGGHDRTIRIWDAKGNDSRQKPLFTVHTFGQVTKFSWRPTCRYHIACFTRTGDQRIHMWDIRRAYLPQASFCHHRNDIGDFLWRPNSDNMISVDRDERLIHAHVATAVNTNQVASLFSLNVTSKGSVHISMPDIDNDYVRSLYREKHVPLTSTSLQKCYAQETMSTFLKWNRTIEGKSLLRIYSNSIHDDSVRQFHKFARRWIFGNGDKSLQALAHICDVNSSAAHDLNRVDLKSTWQMIKILYADSNGLKNHRIHSSKTSRSLSKGVRASDSIGRYYQLPRGKSTSLEKQQQKENDLLSDDLTGDRRAQLKEQKIHSNSKLEIMDETDTYIVRDVITDDLLFLTPDDLLDDNNNTADISDGTNFNIEEMLNVFPVPYTSTETLPITYADDDYDDFLLDHMTRQFVEVTMIDDDNELQSADEYENIGSNMQTSIHSIPPDGSDNFFTIDEGYCPTIQKHSINFDHIIQDTLWHYIESNELQVAVHLLLALYPQFNEQKRIELFNGAHLQWIVMYIEFLQKMRLFVKAKQVTKHCLENEGIPLNYNTSEFDGSIIFGAQAQTRKRGSSCASTPTSTSSKTFPPVPKEFMCSICRLPCRGVLTFCGICFHGGHIDHIKKWFKNHDECSYGCGHRCKNHNSQTYQTRISQRLVSKHN